MVINKHSIFYHCYADDTQLYSSFTPSVNEAEALQNIEQCIDDIRAWMNVNKLKLNDDKSEFIIIGTNSTLSRVKTTALRVGTKTIQASSYVRNIWCYFDQNMRMNEQLKHTCKSAWFLL